MMTLAWLRAHGYSVQLIVAVFINLITLVVCAVTLAAYWRGARKARDLEALLRKAEGELRDAHEEIGALSVKNDPFSGCKLATWLDVAPDIGDRRAGVCLVGTVVGYGQGWITAEGESGSRVGTPWPSRHAALYPAQSPIARLLAERARQDTLWGVQNHSPIYWLAILLEEVGELAHEVRSCPTPCGTRGTLWRAMLCDAEKLGTLARHLLKVQEQIRADAAMAGVPSSGHVWRRMIEEATHCAAVGQSIVEALERHNAGAVNEQDGGAA